MPEVCQLTRIGVLVEVRRLASDAGRCHRRSATRAGFARICRNRMSAPFVSAVRGEKRGIVIAE